MDMFVVSGGERLCGSVSVSGSKNAALPIMAAALACDDVTTLKGVPDLVDVRTLLQLLKSLGVHWKQEVSGDLTLEPRDQRQHIADYDLVRRMRASICVLGPLLAKRGRACVSLPGGCNIGHRPIDLHVKGLAALGADFRIERGYIVATAGRLRGARVNLAGPAGSTVTGTCNVMAAAALARGTTIIESAACEPEVVDLGQYLNSAGARVFGLGTPVIEIQGVDRLQGASHRVIPDRIEAATLMIAAVATRGAVELHNVDASHLTSVIDKLREMGTSITQLGANGNVLSIDGSACSRPTECVATPYPGLPTDVQAQFTSLLATIPGLSIVTDRVFPDRFMHAAELLRMGANLRRDGNSVVITGVEQLHGASVMASDLRASAALVIAALTAQGESVIRRIYHLDRGYEHLEDKLTALGASVRRVTDIPTNVPASLLLGEADYDSREAA